MIAIVAIAISTTALLFAVSGFVLGLMAFIQVRATALSTHSVQIQPQQEQVNLSKYFGTEEDEVFDVPNDKLEETLLQGLR